MPDVLTAAVASIHLAVTAATLQGLPHRTIPATDEHGHTARYGGVALRDVLTQGGVPAGEAIRGKTLTHYKDRFGSSFRVKSVRRVGFARSRLSTWRTQSL